MSNLIKWAKWCHDNNVKAEVQAAMFEAADEIESLTGDLLEAQNVIQAFKTEIERLNTELRGTVATKYHDEIVTCALRQMIEKDKRIAELEAELEVANDEIEADAKCAEDTIEDKDKEIAELEARVNRIAQWLSAYPRTVFIEPTREQWRIASETLDAHKGDNCPSLTAISGSNMRHVVEGLQALLGQKP
jgi:chromosome segregation ATPase